MMDYIIPIIQSWLPVWNAYLVDVFALAFVAFVGCFIHYLVRR